MTRVHLAAGKYGLTKSSALVYQTEGATFCVIYRQQELSQRKALLQIESDPKM